MTAALREDAGLTYVWPDFFWGVAGMNEHRCAETAALLLVFERAEEARPLLRS